MASLNSGWPFSDAPSIQTLGTPYIETELVMPRLLVFADKALKTTLLVSVVPRAPLPRQ